MTLDALRQLGADQLSPVDFHYLEALERRIPSLAPNVRHILEGKLTLAVAAYHARFEEAQCNSAQATVAVVAEQSTALAQLVQSMAQHTPEVDTAHWAPVSESRTELKSVRQFRNTWSKLSAQKQVLQALGQAPKNAGPINSHMLVLRSLELMRDISPDYLNRFMSYADTLLCLDQSDLSAKPATKKAATRVKAATPT